MKVLKFPGSNRLGFRKTFRSGPSDAGLQQPGHALPGTVTAAVNGSMSSRTNGLIALRFPKRMLALSKGERVTKQISAGRVSAATVAGARVRLDPQSGARLRRMAFEGHPPRRTRQRHDHAMNPGAMRLTVFEPLSSKLARLMLIGFLCVAAGCSSHKDVEWTEETRLSNGQVVIVERSDRYRRVMDMGAGFEVGWLYERGSFKASLPAPISRTVQWEGTLQPLVLDVFGSNTVYFVGVPGSGAGIEEWELRTSQSFRDDNPYVVFRLNGNEWVRIRLEQLPAEAKPNLLANTRSFFEKYEEVRLRPGSRIDLLTKIKVDSNPRIAEDLKVIVRPAKTQK